MMNWIACRFLLSAAMTLSLGAQVAMAATPADGDPSFESIASLGPEGRPRYEEIGIKEHPLETKLRYGVLSLEEESAGGTGGLQVIPVVGDPFIHLEQLPDLESSLQEGFLPIITYRGTYQGCQYEEEVFASLLGSSRVEDGTEVVVDFVRLTATNISSTPKPATWTIIFAQGGGAFGEGMPIDVLPPNLGAVLNYWADDNSFVDESDRFLARIEVNGAARSRFYGHFGEFDLAHWKAGAAFQNGFRAVFSLPPGEKRQIIMKIPRQRVAFQSYKRAVERLDYERAKKQVALEWKSILDRGTRFTVPEKRVQDMYRAHLAYTFMNVDRQNKMNNRTGWVPNKVYDYLHLCPGSYEALWPMEVDQIASWLDHMGYSEEVENYLEVFFALQGTGPYTLVPSAPKLNLPQTNFVGTTQLRWMDETGCILHAIGEHYRYTRNKSWLLKHAEAVAKACEWVEAALGLDPDGLLPAGYPIDGGYFGKTYFSDYTTWTGLKAAAEALVDVGFDGGQRWVERANKYRLDILRSTDQAILPVDEFHASSEMAKYDFSSVLPAAWEDVENPREDKDGDGIPDWLQSPGQPGVKSLEKAISQGIVGYFPMGPALRIPFEGPGEVGYTFNLIFPAFAFSTDLLDGSSEEPLFRGARYTGSSLAKLYTGYQEKTHPTVKSYLHPPLYYGYHLAMCYLQRDEIEKVLWTFYGMMADNMSRTTYATSEMLLGSRCPATHTMARVGELLRMMLVREDSFGNRLLLAYAVPRAWLEDGKTITVDRAPTWYGTVSYTIVSKVRADRIEATIHPPTSKPPVEITLRLRHPNQKPIRAVNINGRSYSRFGSDVVMMSGSVLGQDHLSIEVLY
jgi:hypothetical protein